MLRRFAAIAFLVAVPLWATPVLITGKGYGWNLWGGISIEGQGIDLQVALDRSSQFLVFCPAGVACDFKWEGGFYNGGTHPIGGSYQGQPITPSTPASGGAAFEAAASFTEQTPSAIVPVSVSGRISIAGADLYFTGAGTVHISPGEYFGPDFGGPRFLFSNFGYLDYHGTLDEVPEPATLILLAPAILLALRRKLRTPHLR